MRCIGSRQRESRYAPFHVSRRESDLLSSGTYAGGSYRTSSLLTRKDWLVLISARDPVANTSSAPGQEYSLPIEAVTQNRIRLQPDRAYSHTRYLCNILI